MRAVVVEDLTLLRAGIVGLLEAHDFEVIAALDSGVGLVELLVTEQPDVSIVDIRLPTSLTDEGLRAAIDAPMQGAWTADFDPFAVCRADVRP